MAAIPASAPVSVGAPRATAQTLSRRTRSGRYQPLSSIGR